MTGVLSAFLSRLGAQEWSHLRRIYVIERWTIEECS